MDITEKNKIRRLIYIYETIQYVIIQVLCLVIF